jgi:hypothetical protein
MLDKNMLVSLGLKHGFLNWVEHETPPSFFPIPIDCYLNDTDSPTANYLDVSRLYNLLCAIYAEVDIV